MFVRIQYRICPQCFRAVPKQSGELFCANDGTRLLEKCVRCNAKITSPFARFCVNCGLEFSKLAIQELKKSQPQGT
jgi:Double zinc ribbon